MKTEQGTKTAKMEVEKMAVFEEDEKTDAAFAKKVESLDDETLLKNLNLYPYLLENRAIRERLRAVSRDWKKKIEANQLKNSRETLWEYTLYLVHLCPRLLDSPLFKWLKERFYAILMMRHWSSEADKDYWEALNRVRRDFTVTKPKTPERKWILARKYEDYRNSWLMGEISKTCSDLLDIFNSEREDRYKKIRELSRRIKVKDIVVESEIERLSRIYGGEIRSKEDLIMLPYMLWSDLNVGQEEEAREEGRKFWQKTWSPIFKKMRQSRNLFMEKVSEETGLSRESIRKLLRQAVRETSFLS